MYYEGDIIQTMGKKFVVLGISELNDHIYMLYPDNENLFEHELNPKAIIAMSIETMRCIWKMETVGCKNKKEFNLWLMKNKMLYDLLFVSV